jgi:ribosomal protein L7/L12
MNIRMLLGAMDYSERREAFRILQAELQPGSNPSKPFKFATEGKNVALQHLNEDEVQLCEQNRRVDAIKSVRMRLSLSLRESRDLVYKACGLPT